jgi:hypothetical protein
MTNHSHTADLEQSNFEDAVLAAIEKRIGGAVEMFDSDNLGVVAFERLSGSDAGKIDWQELAAALARDTGVGVTCVVHTHWAFDDRCDEEATFIAFDLPSVPADYRDDKYRNLISAVDPSNAPTEQDFVNAKRARTIVDNHLRELEARREMLVSARKYEREVSIRIAEIETLKELEASEQEAVAAVLELDFDRALQVIAATAEAVAAAEVEAAAGPRP